MSVRVVMSRSTSSDSETLIHSNKGHEAHHDSESQDEVAVGLDKDKLDGLVVVLTNKDLGKQMEEGISEETADGEGDHDGQRGGVDVGRA